MISLDEMMEFMSALKSYKGDSYGYRDCNEIVLDTKFLGIHTRSELVNFSKNRKVSYDRSFPVRFAIQLFEE